MVVRDPDTREFRAALVGFGCQALKNPSCSGENSASPGTISGAGSMARSGPRSREQGDG